MVQGDGERSLQLSLHPLAFTIRGKLTRREWRDEEVRQCQLLSSSARLMLKTILAKLD